MIVGRERELQDVGQLVAGWDAGPAVLVVEGEAGIGKTTIWEGGLEAAGPARVLLARAAQGEMPLSFAAVADLLGSELDELLPALAAPRREALEVAPLLAFRAARRPTRARSPLTMPVLRRGKVRIAFTAPGAGTLAARLSKGRTVLAGGSHRYARAGKGSVTLKLSRKGKRALRRARKLTATLTLTFTPRGGQATKASGKVSLRR